MKTVAASKEKGRAVDRPTFHVQNGSPKPTGSVCIIARAEAEIRQCLLLLSMRNVSPILGQDIAQEGRTEGRAAHPAWHSRREEPMRWYERPNCGDRAGKRASAAMA